MTSSVDPDFETRVKELLEEIGPIIDKHTRHAPLDATIILTKSDPNSSEFSFSISSSIDDNDEMVDTIDDVLDAVEEARISGDMDEPEPVRKLQ